MTMLAAFYTAEGIVFAADSQITAKGEAAARAPQTKVLRVPGLGIAGNGLIGYFGLAQVGNEPMDTWLRSTIKDWRASAAIADFYEYLRDRLEAEATMREKKEVSGFHIGAFEKRDGLSVPVFAFLRNTYKFDDNKGTHSDVGPWHGDEQLLAFQFKDADMRTVRPSLRKRQSDNGLPFWYRNGDLPFFAGVWNGLEEQIGRLVHRQGFDSPKTLEGWKALAKTFLTTTGQLYSQLYRQAPPSIGGRPVIRDLPWPD